MVRVFGTACLAEGGVGHHAPVVAIGVGFKLHEAHRGAVLAANLDVQAASVIVNEVYDSKVSGLDAEIWDVFRNGNEASVRYVVLDLVAMLRIIALR